jgi:site-specific DNA-methyltransferase (adenine-specific)
MNKSYSSTYNPDVLSTLANLSSDEVFTPPHIVNQMLDMLPQELFSDKTTTFLDPATKSGVFLREIAKRLIKGLEKEIPDLQERLDHILHNQVFGIAITELTSLLSRRSLYCSKYANSKFSISLFEHYQGNIEYQLSLHEWKDGKCKYCGASKRELDREFDKENYAYPFIHNLESKDYSNMKFDVIVGNPPYQLNVGNEGGNSSKAKAIYNLFIDNAIKLNPKFLLMITPSRWMTRSTEGISVDWIDRFMNDSRIRKVYDFLDANEIFSGSAPKGGVNYFLWERGFLGSTEYYLFDDINDLNPTKYVGSLNFENTGFVIRDKVAKSIIQKIIKVEGNYINDGRNFSHLVSPKDFFTDKERLTSSWNLYKKNSDKEHNIKLYLNRSIHGLEYGWVSLKDIPKNHETIKLSKVYISAASGSGNDSKVLGKAFYGEPNSVCSQTYLVIGYSKKHNFDEIECANIIQYLQTRFFRYLVSVLKKTQNGPRRVYQLVPLIDLKLAWTDEMLFERYSLNKSEIEFISSSISPWNNYE